MAHSKPTIAINEIIGTIPYSTSIPMKNSRALPIFFPNNSKLNACLTFETWKALGVEVMTLSHAIGMNRKGSAMILGVNFRYCFAESFHNAKGTMQNTAKADSYLVCAKSGSIKNSRSVLIADLFFKKLSNNIKVMSENDKFTISKPPDVT